MRFWQRAQQHQDTDALIDVDGSAVTAGELVEAANKLVHAGRARGLATGSKLATLLPNCREFLVAYLAATQAGWYLVPVNYHLVAREVAHILRDSGAQMVIGHERFATELTAAVDDAPSVSTRVAVGEIAGFDRFDEVLAPASSMVPQERTAGGIMHYTSGTTGRPKGVERPLPDTSPDDASVPFADLLGLLGVTSSADDVHLCGSPLYHTAVLAFAGAALHEGQIVVLMDRWTAEDMLALIERHGVTNTHMVPTQFNRLLQLPASVQNAYDVSSLRYVIHGAAPCAVDTKRRMIEWWGPVIYEYYGTTEGGGTVVDSRRLARAPGDRGPSLARRGHQDPR
ncbi:MAG: AMP-binding protein [Xanthomonadales bacterium]|nr:AMP-binding protein [Xanthomonadales bacterium]